MERRNDFEAVCADVDNALNKALARHNLEIADALAVCAVLGAIASPLKLHHLRGGGLMKQVGRLGLKAYSESCVARQIEEIKSPHSLVVNPMMDAIAGVLAKKGAIGDDELPQETAAFLREPPQFPYYDLIEQATELANRIPGPPYQTAREHLSGGGTFASALRYLEEAGIVSFSEEDGTWCLSGYPALLVH